jgi:hypothetical protein
MGRWRRRAAWGLSVLVFVLYVIVNVLVPAVGLYTAGLEPTPTARGIPFDELVPRETNAAIAARTTPGTLRP